MNSTGLSMNATEQRPIILVGVGESGLAGFEGAVDHAVDYAHRWGATVKLVHGVGSAAMHAANDEASRHRLQLGHRLLKQAARQFVRQGGGVRPEVAMVHGLGPEALIAESGSASLIVIQRRRLGRFARIRVGSTSAQVAAHASCPVLIARDSWDPPPGTKADAGTDGEGEHWTPSGVVVAVDARGHCASALDAAYKEAKSRGTSLTALHVWDVFPTISGPFTALPGDEQRAYETAKAVLDSALAERRWIDDAEVEVERRLARGPLVPTLLEASRTHELLVIARHGDGRALYTSLGSTVRQVMDRAECPVLVTPTVEAMAGASAGSALTADASPSGEAAQA